MKLRATALATFCFLVNPLGRASETNEKSTVFVHQWVPQDLEDDVRSLDVKIVETIAPKSPRIYSFTVSNGKRALLFRED